jgi:nucleotide-binding universal stress UspA family protein
MVENNNDTQSPSILVCLDITNASKMALRYACYKAKKSGFSVRILAVMESSHKNLIFASRAIGHEKKKEIERHLEILVSAISKETGVTPSISIREGDITTEIIREIKSSPNYNMLIFGKSHNSLSDNTVLPEIAKKIGNKINIPVTIVPENLSNEFLDKLA